ncbi:hypothetical protein IMSAGC009_04066 [Lachnospiraceae bacterium]|nr:hypothetical protein IMSAGC009_04066 [Lachnospiraceae bacterium]
MELFKLFGMIAVKNTEANNAIDETSNKAASFSEKLSDGFTAVGSKAASLGTKMSIGLTGPITLLGTKAIQATADFESAMSEVGAISGATGDELAALESKAKEMGETTKFSASESAEALKYMAMAGWKTSDMLDGLEGIMNLAAASGESLGTTSDIVTDALTAFGLTASDSGHFADILATASSNANTNVGMMGETFKYVAPVAGALRYSAEDTAEAIGLMANAGIKSSQAGTSLRSILTNLQGEVKFAGAQFGEMTIQTTNADGSMRSLGDILGDCRTAFSMMSESEKACNAEMVVGKEAMSGFLAIMNAAPSDIEKLNHAINNCDGSAKSMADTMNNNLSGQITLLKSQLEGLAIQFVTLIMPYLKQAVEWLSKVCDWISGLDDGTKKMIITAAAVLAAAGPVLIFLGKVATGIGSIISVGGKLIGGIGGLIGKISGGGGLLSAIAAIPGPVWIVIGVLAALVAAGVAVYKNWDEIKEWAGKVWDKTREIVGGAVDKIREFFSGIIDFVKNNWQALATFLVNPFVGGFKLLYDNCESFRNFIDDFLGKLKEGFHNFTSNISEKAGELKDRIVNKFNELKDGSIEKFNELKDKATEKIENLKENAAEKFTQLKEGAVEKVNSLKENAVQKINELKDHAVERVEKLKESAVDKFNQLKDRGTEKVNALKESAVSKFNEMKDKVSEKINALKDKGVTGFEALRAKGIEKFDSLRSGVSEKLDAVKSFVANTVDKLKSFFDFDWKLPHIKLPHFNISGSFSLDPPSIPHIGVDWYKKAMDSPMIMDKPTAFGINQTGQIMAGGEAGSEVVSGTETLMEMISAAVSENNIQIYELLDRLYALLSEYLPMFANMQMVLDSGALVGELAQPLNEELGKIIYMRRRHN